MTYSINGTELTLQPTTGRWMPRTLLGIDGNGHPVYSAFRDFELRWQAIGPDELYQLLVFYNNLSGTSFAVTSLPEFGATAYQFKNYSGTIAYEPEIAEYFAEHILNAIMLISKIRT